MLGQHLADVAGAVGEGALAELAAGDRQVGDGHWEAVGTWRTHRLSSCQPCQSGRDCMLAGTHDSRYVRISTAPAIVHRYPDLTDLANGRAVVLPPSGQEMAGAGLSRKPCTGLRPGTGGSAPSAACSADALPRRNKPDR